MVWVLRSFHTFRLSFLHGFPDSFFHYIVHMFFEYTFASVLVLFCCALISQMSAFATSGLVGFMPAAFIPGKSERKKHAQHARTCHKCQIAVNDTEGRMSV